MKDQS
jgi:hypothetical protein